MMNCSRNRRGPVLLLVVVAVAVTAVICSATTSPKLTQTHYFKKLSTWPGKNDLVDFYPPIEAFPPNEKANLTLIFELDDGLKEYLQFSNPQDPRSLSFKSSVGDGVNVPQLLKGVVRAHDADSEAFTESAILMEMPIKGCPNKTFCAMTTCEPCEDCPWTPDPNPGTCPPCPTTTTALPCALCTECPTITCPTPDPCPTCPTQSFIPQFTCVPCPTPTSQGTCFPCECPWRSGTLQDPVFRFSQPYYFQQLSSYPIGNKRVDFILSIEISVLDRNPAFVYEVDDGLAQMLYFTDQEDPSTLAFRSLIDVKDDRRVLVGTVRARHSETIAAESAIFIGLPEEECLPDCPIAVCEPCTECPLTTAGGTCPPCPTSTPPTTCQPCPDCPTMPTCPPFPTCIPCPTTTTTRPTTTETTLPTCPPCPTTPEPITCPVCTECPWTTTPIPTTTTQAPFSCGIVGHSPDTIIDGGVLDVATPSNSEFWRGSVWNVTNSATIVHPHNKYVVTYRTPTSYWFTASAELATFFDVEEPGSETLFRSARLFCFDGSEVVYSWEFRVAYSETTLKPLRPLRLMV